MSFSHFVYKNILKPVFFRMDPEFVHDQITSTGQWLGRHKVARTAVSGLFNYQHPKLEQTILGIHFKNPVGLAAGFDKDALLTDILPSVGFGFEEIGSVTGEPCAGNAGQRLWRLKQSQGLVVYYGLKNRGCDEIAERLKTKRFSIPLGVSVAKTNSESTVDEQAGIDDYVKAYRAFVKAGVGSYFTINISCPNAFGGEPFTEAGKLDRLLMAIRAIPSPKPIFIKLPADLPLAEIDRLVEVSRKNQINGFICTNLTKDRVNAHIKDPNVPEKGGMSGKVVEELSNNLISHIYQTTKREFVLIGCGGVFSAEDAYRKIKLGASLVQIITGMVFEGPQVIGEINRGLVKLLERDGYENISQAIGKNIDQY